MSARHAKGDLRLNLELAESPVAEGDRRTGESRLIAAERRTSESLGVAERRPSESSLGVAERRTSERHAISLRVDYKRMNTFFADYAKNISKGGTFIRTSQPLEVGTEFVFVLSIPEKSEHLKLRGEVMWTVDEAKATRDQPAGMGIRFRFVDDAERQELERVVAKLMSDELGTHIAAKLLGKT